MGVLRLCVVTTLAALTIPSTDLAYAKDWGQWRGDAQRSAQSPWLFDFDQTGIRWQFPTGASSTPVIPWDLDSDGELEWLSVEGGRIIARRKSGALLWDTPPLLARRVVRIEDLDTDGALDIVVDATNSVIRLHAETGEILWQSTTTVPIENIGSILFADTTGDTIPEVILADVAGNAGKPYLTGSGYVFSMDPSPTPGVPLAKTQEGTRDYESGLGLAVADVDNDQIPEIVAPGKSRLYSYDAVTGLLEGSSPDYSGLLGKENLANARTYISDVDGDGFSEVFLFLDTIFVGTPSRRVVVFDRSSESEWTWRYTLVAPDPASGSHTWPALPVQDLDGDGSVELTTSFFSPQTGWETWIVAAATGELLQKLPGQRLTHIFDPDNSFPLELLTVSSPFQVPGEFETRHIMRYTKTATDIETVFSASDSLLVAEVYSGPTITTPQVVVVSDSDQDGFGDVVGVYDLITGAASLELPITGALQHTSVKNEAGEPHLVLSYATGEVSLVDAKGTVTNDGDGDGTGDVVYRGFETRRAYTATVAGVPLVSVAGAGGRVIVVDATSGDPVTEPNIVLQTRANLPQIPLFLSGTTSTGVLILRSDTSRHLVFQRLTLDSAIDWDTVIGGPGGTLQLARDPLVADVNGDSEDDVVATVEDKTLSQVYRVVAVDGASGQLLWTSPNIPTPGGNIGWLSYLSEKNTVYLVANSTLLAIDAATGATTQQTPNPQAHYYGIPSLVDIDGDASAELALLGTSKGCIVYNSDLTVRWEKTLGNMSHAPAAALYVPEATSIAVAYGSSPRVDWLAADGSPLYTRYFTQGSVYFSPDNLPEGSAKSQIREIIAAKQLTPQAEPGYIIATSDGFLHALTTAGTPVWTLAFAAGIGSPAVLDVDFDSVGELAVPAAAGTLALIDRSTLPPPAWVYENDGTAPATSPDADIDIQSSCTTVSANWAPVAGASAYVVRLLSEHGSLIAQHLVEGNTTQWTITALSLTPGQLVRLSVAGVELQNGGNIMGPATLSDGVRPNDNGPPEIVGATVDPPVFFPGGDAPSTTTVSATFVDDKALQSATITIGLADGPVQWSRVVPLSGTSAEWSEVFNGDDDTGLPMDTGTYQVRFSLKDVSSNSVTATSEVTLCRHPWIYDRIKQACVLQSDPPDDPDVTVQDVQQDNDTVESTLDVFPDTVPTEADLASPDQDAPDTAQPQAEAVVETFDSSTEAESGCGGGCRSSRDTKPPLFALFFAMWAVWRLARPIVK